MLKTVAYTVRAATPQAERWRRAASTEGHRAVGTWLAAAAEAYLKSRTRPIGLSWRRYDPFRVRLVDGREATVRGAVSHPFGIYRGGADGPCRRVDAFSLVYLPARRILATLRHQRQAKDLAAELARVWVRWDGAGSEPSEDPAPIVARHVRESV